MNLEQMRQDTELRFYRAKDTKDQMEVQLDLLKAQMAELRGRAQLLGELMELQKKETPDVEANPSHVVELEQRSAPASADGQGMARVVPVLPGGAGGPQL
jgi:hypothetical protein